MAVSSCSCLQYSEVAPLNLILFALFIFMQNNSTSGHVASYEQKQNTISAPRITFLLIFLTRFLHAVESVTAGSMIRGRKFRLNLKTIYTKKKTLLIAQCNETNHHLCFPCFPKAMVENLPTSGEILLFYLHSKDKGKGGIIKWWLMRICRPFLPNSLPKYDLPGLFQHGTILER